MLDIRPTVLANVRKNRSEDIAHRVERAISLLREQGKQPSFYSVSSVAQVARSTLYRREDLKRLVIAAREKPSVSCKSDAFDDLRKGLRCENEQLRAEIENLTERYRRSQSECMRLRRELEKGLNLHAAEQSNNSGPGGVNYYFVSLASLDAA